jgi:hypothetical protein
LAGHRANLSREVTTMEPNERAALDAGRPLSFHVGRHRPGAKERGRSAWEQ